jgi:hypothetical protein
LQVVINSPINLVNSYTEDNPYQFVSAKYMARPDYRAWIRQCMKTEVPIVLDLTALDLHDEQTIYELKKFLNLTYNQDVLYQNLFAVIVAPAPVYIDVAAEIVTSANCQLWLIDQGTGVDDQRLPNVRQFNPSIILHKRIDGLITGGRRMRIEKLREIGDDFEYSMDFSQTDFHAFGIWRGHTELMDAGFTSVITSLPLRLGLRGKELDELTPFPNPLNFSFERDNFPGWTRRIVQEFREQLA